MSPALLTAFLLTLQDPGAEVLPGTESAVVTVLGEGDVAMIQTVAGWATYDLAGRRVLKQFSGPKQPAWPSAISGDGKTALVRGDAWSLERGEVAKALTGAEVQMGRLNRDGRVAALLTVDGLAIYDTGSGSKLSTIKVTPFAMALSPDGTLLATGETGVVRVWDTKTGTEKAKFEAHEPGEKGPGRIEALRFAPDGRRVASSWSRKAGMAASWDVAGGGAQMIKCPLNGTVRAFAFSADGRRFAATDGSRTAVLEAGGTVLATHLSGRPMALPDDGSRLVVAGKTFVSLPLSGVGVPERLLGRSAGDLGEKAVLSADGALVACGTSAWETKTGKLVLVAPLKLVAFSRDGKRAFGQTPGQPESNQLVAYDLATGKEQSRFKVKANVLTRVVDLSDGKRFVIATNDSNLLVVETGGKTALQVRLRESVHDFSVSADGKRALVVMKDDENLGRAHIANLVTGEVKMIGPILTDLKEAVLFGALRPDGNVAAVVNAKGELALIDITSNLVTRTATGASGRVEFSPDGKTLAVHRGGTMTVEETLSGRVVARLVGPGGWFGYLDDATIISLPELAVWKTR